jgi:cysteine desulfurase
VDAVQAYGKMKITPGKMGIDIMTISSHKIHGPKGLGALYIKKGIRIKPLILGGGQESHIRSGTENVPGICGFGLAADIIHKRIGENNDLCHKIKKLFIEHLSESVEGSIVISPPDASPHILNVSFGDIRAEVLLHHLETKNIYVSTGSACSSRKNTHSHVLKSVGLKKDMIEGAIRFSFSEFNKIEDVENTIHEIKEILPKISIKRGGKK